MSLQKLQTIVIFRLYFLIRTNLDLKSRIQSIRHNASAFTTPDWVWTRAARPKLSDSSEGLSRGVLWIYVPGSKGIIRVK